MARVHRESFLADAAHDLRAPLNAIKSWAHVLENLLGNADPPVHRAIAGIMGGVEQQARLIDDLVRMEDAMHESKKPAQPRPQRTDEHSPDPDTLEGPGDRQDTQHKDEDRDEVTRRGER